MQTMTRHSLPGWLPLILVSHDIVLASWQPVYAVSAAPEADEHGEGHSEEADHGEEDEEGHIALTAEQIKYAGIALSGLVPPASERPYHCTDKSCPMRSVSTPYRRVSRGYPTVTKQVGDPVKAGRDVWQQWRVMTA